MFIAETSKQRVHERLTVCFQQLQQFVEFAALADYQ
jgi:hypothetical protein